MNELISKQKAIDEIKEFQSQVTCDFSKDWLNGMDEGFAHSVNVIELIDTVEAIPIEWIRKYTEENRLYQSDDFDFYISDMIADWAEEKKDIRKCGICKHFLGGGDFGTCCDQTYGLKYRDSKVCEKYSERKE